MKERSRPGGGSELSARTTIAVATVELLTDVIVYLVEHPDASASEVAREVRGRRSDVLRLVKLARAAGVVDDTPDGATRPGTGSYRGSGASCPACGVSIVLTLDRGGR